MRGQGYLTGKQMAGTFQFLHSRELVWTRRMREYLLGEREERIDLSAWNADTTRMPARMHHQYLTGLYLRNALAAGRWRVDGHAVSLADIRVPVFLVGTENDHVSPWHSVYQLHRLCDAELTFVLVAGGHNAGIVSEPGHPRRHYRIALRPAQGPWLHAERWQQQAEQHDGSWWPAWHAWLAARSGKPVRAKPIPAGVAVADAPGTFVLKRYADSKVDLAALTDRRRRAAPAGLQRKFAPEPGRFCHRFPRSAQISDRHHQRHRIEGRFIEAEAQVEGLGLFGQGMHDHAADADRVGCMDDAQRGVLEEGAAEPLPVMARRDRQAAEHDDRDRVRHVAAEAPGRQRGPRRWRPGRSSPTTGVFADDEGARGTADLVGRRAASSQLLSEATPQSKPAMWWSGVSGSGRAASGSGRCQGAFLRIVRRSRSLGWAGRSSRFRNRRRPRG